MQFISLVMAFGAIATAAASPASSTLERRAGGLFACNAPDFSNSEGCILLHPEIGQCEMFPSGFVGSISSIGPDSDLVCTLYDGGACQDNEGLLSHVVSPGYNRLHDLSQGNWEDRIASYRCFRN